MMWGSIRLISLLLLISLITSANTAAQQSELALPVSKPEWYESFKIRGYVQVRYNGLESNKNLGCEQCDASWGGDERFFIRRARIIFYGQINPHVYFYIQPDFASSVSSSSLHFAQLRDAYFDVNIDKKKEYRFRIGQSKVPFGFENLQSSQNRLPLDRNDALNSAVSNERDLGLMFYWAPEARRKMFSELVKEGLKGSGDYGVFGIGAYNGQTANRPDLNENKHLVTRISWPFNIGSQIVETGFQTYHGQYVIPESSLSDGVKVKEDRNFKDERMAATFILYPKPFGIQAEYNMGYGPEFNTVSDSIEVKALQGGYITLSYKTGFKDQILIPFTRLQYYEGGKKHELDARSYKVNEFELGLEWQPVPQFEFVAMYVVSSRRYEDFTNQNNHQKGSLLRLQAQVNF